VSAFRCMDCNKLFKKLEQRPNDRGQLVVSGYCEDCNCYTERPVEEDEDDFEALPRWETEEELDERLRALGYDPVELVERMRAKIEKAIDESPLNPKNKP
jgi:hypothetical protein